MPDHLNDLLYARWMPLAYAGQALVDVIRAVLRHGIAGRADRAFGAMTIGRSDAGVISARRIA